MTIRFFLILTLLLFSSSFLRIARCEADPDVEADSQEDEGILELLVRMSKILVEGALLQLQAWKPYVFSPKTPQDVSFAVDFIFFDILNAVAAGEESELLVGIGNEGESSINVIAIQASVYLPFDHRYLIQNLTAQAFNNASVPPSAQATFPYIFAVSKFLQSGEYDLVGTIVYEIDQHPYRSTFYNATIDVTEVGGMFSVESVFLFCLAVALLGLLVIWICGQLQNFSKKSKRVTKVEVGTGTTDANMDEWLEGTAYTQSQSNKSKKKK